MARTVRELLGVAEDLDRLDAEVLLAEALGQDRTWLIAHADDAPDQGIDRYLDWINRRRAGEPVAYLTGWREFWSLRLRVTPDTLIPRPETEHLVERALAALAKTPSPSILDLGTGSGAIALAMAQERPDAAVHAVDASLAALCVAQENALRLALTRVVCHHGSWYAALPEEAPPFDVIVANPPYVAEDDPHLDRGDCAWEPRLALTPGDNELSAYDAILAGATRHLKPGGMLLVEHGHDQRERLFDRFQQSGLVAIEALDDLAGIPRVICGRRPVADRR